MSTVYVGSTTHTTTYVATNLLRSVRLLVTAAGLDPTKFVSTWSQWEDGIAHWLSQQGLSALVLEVFDPNRAGNDLVGRFDFTLSYAYGGDGDMWIDPDIIEFTIKKSGSYPSLCKYRLVATTTAFATDPPTGSWVDATFRSTDGFSKHSVGTSVAGGATSASLSYYRKVS